MIFYKSIESIIFNTKVGISPIWDFEFKIEHKSLIIKNIPRTDKTHLKFVSMDGSIQNGYRKSILFSVLLDEPPGFKIYCEETIPYKISVVTNNTF